HGPNLKPDQRKTNYSQHGKRKAACGREFAPCRSFSVAPEYGKRETDQYGCDHDRSNATNVIDPLANAEAAYVCVNGGPQQQIRQNEKEDSIIREASGAEIGHHARYIEEQ